MNLAQTITNLPELNWATVLFGFGPLGAISAGLAWFCVREIRVLADKISDGNESVTTELRVLGHRINGIAKQRWADMLELPHIKENPSMKRMIEKEILDSIEEPEVRELRSRSKHPIPPK